MAQIFQPWPPGRASPDVTPCLADMVFLYASRGVDGRGPVALQGQTSDQRRTSYEARRAGCGFGIVHAATADVQRREEVARSAPR